MTRTRKTPTRTCTACAASGDKKRLIRVVRTPEGHVEIDRGGKANGRGAYLCANRDCFEVAHRRRRLDSALRVKLQDDDYNRLRRDFDECLTDTASQQGE